VRAAPQPDDPIARARVRTRSGRWLVAHGAVLGDGPAAKVAVILEPARAPELAPLIAAAYGLTEREWKVTQLVARGLPTSDIAGRLHLSPWTVQDHLKAIFTKTGTGTRGELVARLFFDHYAAGLSQ
jgi:DNA-binding NarL/FixJ family response regulator